MANTFFDSLYTITDEISECNVSMGYVGNMIQSPLSNADFPNQDPSWVTVIDSEIKMYPSEKHARKIYHKALNEILDNMRNNMSQDSPF